MSNDKNPKKKPTGTIDLGFATGAFSTIFQRKRKMLQESVGQAEQEAQRRRSLILRIMASARKSLTDVGNIDLGEYFKLSLDVSERQGWPGVAIRMVNIEDPISEYPMFKITAHDRKQSATIEIFPGSKDAIAVHLVESEARFPIILKRAVRSYLDEITELALKAEVNRSNAVPEPVIQMEDVQASEDDLLSNVNVFCDHETPEPDLLETLDVDEDNSLLFQDFSDIEI